MDCDLIIDGNGATNEQNNSCLLPSGNQGVQWEFQLKASEVVNVEPQQQQHQEKKKKCRGNRKLQRYRRRLRAKGLDPTAVSNLEQMAGAHQNEELNNEMETDVTTLPIDQVFPFHSNSKKSMC